MARSIPRLAVPAKPPAGMVKESSTETERKEQRSSIEGHVENGAGTPMLSGDARMEEAQKFQQADNLYLRVKERIVNSRKPKFSKNVFIAVLLFLLFGSIAYNVYQTGCKEVKSLPSVPGPANTTSCSKGWKQHGGQCYFFSDAEGTWDTSQSYCASLGGSLVTMDSQWELDYVLRSKHHEYLWIGLQREDVGHPWKLPNGSLFSEWFSIKGEGFCAYLSEEAFSSTWCSNKRYWICRKPIRAMGEKH